MTEWKLVPVEPTKEMVKSAEDYMEFIDTTGEVWDAMLATAPKASEDGKLEKRIATALAVSMFGTEDRMNLEGCWWTDIWPDARNYANCCWKEWVPQARAVLKMLEGLSDEA